MKFDLNYIKTPKAKKPLPLFPFIYLRRLLGGEKDAKSARALLKDYQKGHLNELKGEKLRFDVEGNVDVYNITAPFELNGKTYIAGRLDKHQEFLRSLVTFFTPDKDGAWHKVKEAPTFKLEDPAVAKINNELVFSGIKIMDPKSDPVKFATVFYRGKDLKSLRQFAVGPEQMKDIRLVQLKDGKIGVFTRPQGEKGGLGTIGFVVINSLSELTAEKLLSAKLFENQFAPQHWGGANEVHVLENGDLGVLSHYAYSDTDDNGNYRRNYFATAFKYNPETGKRTPLKIIATRSNFPEGPAKTDDLHNVIFSGGLVRDGKGHATFYGGLSDAEAGRLNIPDPFAN